MIRVATCVPRQHFNRVSKLEWLANAMRTTECDLFLTPQEYLGGTYIMGDDLHMEADWLKRVAGDLARSTGKALGIGACVKHETGGATEDYLYFEGDGTFRGYHRKFALPSYDDVRAKGAGRLWPETSYAARVRPVEIPSLGLRIGTVFCWEVFSLSIFPAYSFAGCNLIAHPIKFAPRGWLKLSKPTDEGAGGEKRVLGFDQNDKSELWVDRLLAAGRHEALCPIAVSCNTWALGAKYRALVGHVDEVQHRTELLNLPSTPEQDHIHKFEMNPGFYSALDSLYSAGAFKEVAGSIDGYSQAGEFTMHVKMRRLEGQLIGGTTRLDCLLKASTDRLQKRSTQARAAKRLKEGA